ncbi:hypothetical protein BHE74_00058950 [Ensete ventricosum]|nr:hypothetical protein BHE74_00058950 [Ensete ventricosum]
MNTSGGANLAEKRATQSSRTNSVRRIQAEPRETKSHLPPGHLNPPPLRPSNRAKKDRKEGNKRSGEGSGKRYPFAFATSFPRRPSRRPFTDEHLSGQRNNELSVPAGGKRILASFCC